MNMAQVLFYMRCLENRCPDCGQTLTGGAVVYLSKTHKRGKVRVYTSTGYTEALVEWLLRLNFGLPVDRYMEEWV